MTVPDDWAVAKIADVVSSIRAGVSLDGEDRIADAGEAAVLRTGAVLRGRFDATQQKVVAAGDAHRLRTPVAANSIILCRKNSEEVVGASVLVEMDIPNVYLSDLLWEIRPTPVTDVKWLSSVLQSADIRSRLRLAATGTQATMKNISRDRLLNVPIVVPPLPEQRKIAAILSTWDDAIERLTSLRTAATRERDWLRANVLTGMRRLPGFASNWKIAPIATILHEHELKSTGLEEVFSVSVHKGLVNQIEHLGRSFAAKETGHYNRVRPGDIVYTKSPTGDFPLGIIKQSKVDQEAIVSPLYGVFQPTSIALGAILHGYFESPELTRRFLHPLVQKGAKNTIAITNQKFLDGGFSYPTDEAEQRAIAQLLDASERQIALVKQEESFLQRQKRGLMQKLLTGEIRVNVANEVESAEVSHG